MCQLRTKPQKCSPIRELLEQAPPAPQFWGEKHPSPYSSDAWTEFSSHKTFPQNPPKLGGRGAKAVPNKSAMKSLVEHLSAFFTPWHGNSKSALEAGVHSPEKNDSKHWLSSTKLFAQVMLCVAILSVGMAISNSAVFAQSITPTITTSTLQSTLAGSASGATVSNVTITSNVSGKGISVGTSGVGTFTNAGGFPGDGIVLRTGTLNSRTISTGGGGSFPNFDITTVEFDVKPQYNSFGLNYSFFSWEYPEYVGSSFNDNIDIIITGPGLPVAGVNLASLPNTTTPIQINTINGTTNSAFFFKAGCSLLSSLCPDAVNAGSEFTMDGGTVPLKNFTAQVQAGQTYHVKATINDIADSQKDSQAYFNTVFSGPPDTTISKSVSPLGPVTPGTQLTYSITLSNKGISSDNVNVSDNIPSNSTYVAGSASNGGTLSGSTINWSNLIVPAGTCANVACTSTTPGTLTLTFKVLAGTILTPIQNNVSFSTNLPYTPSSTASNTVATPVGYSDLTITKTHTGSFTQGQVGATYTLTATNSGAGATNGTVTVVDTLPVGLTATAISGTGWTCTLATLTCTRSDALAVGASYPSITITVTVASNAAPSVTNSATVSGGGEATTTNNSTTDLTNINGIPDLTITKTHTGNFTKGQTGVYTLTVTNSGTAATSSSMSVTDTLPTGLSFVSGTGTGWTCSATGQNVTCTNPGTTPLAANGTSLITITVNVTASTPVGTNSITNTANVSGGGETNTTNNSATDPTTVIALADLRLSKIATPSSPSVGGNFTYTITVTNDGPSPATNVQVTDKLPLTTEVLINSSSITATQGSTAYNAITPSVLWTVGTLAPNASATLTIPATRLTPIYNLNIAEVTASDQPDPDSTPNNKVAGEDDQASVTVPEQLVDIAVTKTVDHPTPTVGQTVVFTVSVTNTSSTFIATGVGLKDVLPAGLAYQSSNPGQGVYNSGTGVWSVGSLSVGSTATLTIPATVNASGTITNTAQLSALDQSDSNSANNSGSAVLTVSVPSNPKLILVKRITAINANPITTVVDPNTTADPNDNEPNWPTNYLKGAIDGGIVKPGDEMEYTIYFLSSGDVPLTKIAVCDLVPANNTFSPSAFNGLTPTDGGLPGADSGMALAIGPTMTYLSNAADTDRGEFFVSGTTPTTNCSGANTNGAVVVKIVTGANTIPNATAPGTPNNSYGFIRFRAKVN
jgi:uncharacterized repeat protein (TIGR01451 family)